MHKGKDRWNQRSLSSSKTQHQAVLVRNGTHACLLRRKYPWIGRYCVEAFRPFTQVFRGYLKRVGFVNWRWTST